MFFSQMHICLLWYEGSLRMPGSIPEWNSSGLYSYCRQVPWRRQIRWKSELLSFHRWHCGWNLWSTGHTDNSCKSGTAYQSDHIQSNPGYRRCGSFPASGSPCTIHRKNWLDQDHGSEEEGSRFHASYNKSFHFSSHNNFHFQLLKYSSCLQLPE